VKTMTSSTEARPCGPYGVYDLANDEGWVSVGERADTAEFAVETISAGGAPWQARFEQRRGFDHS